MPLSSPVAFVYPPYGVSINLSKWIQAGRVIAGSPADGVFSHLEDAVNEAALLGKACDFSGTWTLLGSLVIPSGMVLEGHGWTRSSVIIPNNLNAPVIKNTGATSDITLRNFKISGNSVNQPTSNALRCGVLFDQSATNILVENIWADDINDWGFEFLGSDITVRRCRASNIIGINDTNGVRAGFLFGSSSPSFAASQITVDTCLVSSITQPFVDGFIFENGSDATLVNSRCLNLLYTGFKMKMDRMRVIGNYASGNLVGFQTQGPLRNLIQSGNTAYRNNASGFQYNQADTVNPGYDWSITGNQAIENGQNAGGGQTYGFNFDNSVSASVDEVLFSGNTAIDKQGAPTQSRGLSIGVLGTYSNFTLGPFFAKGNTVDVYQGTSLDLPTFVYGETVGFGGGAGYLSAGQSAHNLQFFANAIPANSGVTLCTDGFSGRGYVMPKAGWLVGQYVKSSAAVTAGSVTFSIRKNGVNTNNDLVIVGGTFNKSEDATQLRQFAAGDIIDLTYNANAGFLPAGTDNFDATVVVYY